MAAAIRNLHGGRAGRRGLYPFGRPVKPALGGCERGAQSGARHDQGKGYETHQPNSFKKVRLAIRSRLAKEIADSLLSRCLMKSQERKVPDFSALK
jgi:hypothetical protein